MCWESDKVGVGGTGALELRIYKIHVRSPGRSACDVHRLLDVVRRSAGDEGDAAVRSRVDGGGEAAGEQNGRTALIDGNDTCGPSSYNVVQESAVAKEGLVLAERKSIRSAKLEGVTDVVRNWNVVVVKVMQSNEICCVCDRSRSLIGRITKRLAIGVIDVQVQVVRDLMTKLHLQGIVVRRTLAAEQGGEGAGAERRALARNVRFVVGQHKVSAGYEGLCGVHRLDRDGRIRGLS